MKRINSIDNIRLILVILIIYWHIICSDINIPKIIHINCYEEFRQLIFPIAYKLVNYLFIISGVLFNFSLNKNIQSILCYIKHKIRGYWPMLFISNLLITIVSYCGFNFPIVQHEANFLNLFFIHKEIGLTNILTNNGPAWYLCALFWASIILLCIVKGIKDKDYLIPIMIFFTVCFINYNVIILRPIVFMGFGFVVGEIYNYIKGFFKCYLINSGLEILLLICIVKSCICKTSCILYSEVVFSLFLLITLFNKGCLSKLLNSINLKFISKYCLSIYLSQEFAFRILRGGME